MATIDLDTAIRYNQLTDFALQQRKLIAEGVFDVAHTHGQPSLDLNEKAWERVITRQALQWGWRVFHDQDARPVMVKGRLIHADKRTPGYPDLTLLRPPRLIWAESKKRYGRLSVEQLAWFTDAQESGIEVGLWRPHMWQEIVVALLPDRTHTLKFGERELTGLAGSPRRLSPYSLIAEKIARPEGYLQEW